MRLASCLISARIGALALVTALFAVCCLPKLDSLEAGAAGKEATVNPAKPGPGSNDAAGSGSAQSFGTSAQSSAVESSTQAVSKDAAMDRTCRSCPPDAGVLGSVSDAGLDAAAAPDCSPGNYLWLVDGGRVECQPCEPGTFSLGPNSERCTPHGRCQLGTFTIATGTVDRDVVCAGCPSGYFAAEVGMDSCVKWRDCQPGQFVEEGGSSTADRQCGNCVDGETSAVLNSGACTVAGQCGAGFVQSPAAGGGGGPECAACSPGTYCAGGETPVVACGSDVWDDDANPATPCVLKTTCLAGNYVAEPGTSTSDRECRDCAEGFTDVSNAEVCQAWSDCEPGQYVAALGTAYADRVCSDCDDGWFSDVENSRACETWRTCLAPNAYETAAPSAESDRVCGACVSPEIALEDNARACGVVAFQMVDGEVAMEAEHFHVAASQASEAHDWQALELAGTSGGHCLELTPDVDSTWLNAPATTAPKLEFNVNFTQTGSFYIHVRGDTGARTLGTSDSCFAGVDGVATNAFMFSNVSGAWGWLSQPTSVTSSGVHVVQIFGREDGFRIDKIVVSDSNVPPVGDGPPESSQL